MRALSVLRLAVADRSAVRMPSAAATAVPPAVAGLLPLAEEGLVVHRFAVRVILQHVPHVVVVVGNAAAQPRGLHQAQEGEVAARGIRGTHAEVNAVNGA